MSKTEWKEYEMSELIEEISMGPFGSNIKVECFTDSGVPVLNGSNLVGFRLNEDSFNYVTEEKATSLGKANAYRGDIVITHRGTLGQIVYIPQNSKYSRYVISQSQFRVRCNEKVIPEYLVYYFHSRLGQHKLLSNASQVGVPSLARPTSTFQKLTISIPPIAKQKEIVKILSSLDDKIELNNAINRNLEEQAQAIFKSWFVDFEPFDGEMPKDWSIGKLSDIAEYEKEKISLSELTEETYYSTENMLSNKTGVTSATNLPTIKQTTRCFSGETIISNIRPYFKKIFYCTEDSAGCSTDVLCFKPKNKLLATYNYNLLYSDNFFDYMVKGSKGTKMPRGDKSQIMNYEICIPSDEYIQKFDGIVSKLQMQIQNLKKETTQLTKTRDALLPELMSGDLGC